MTGVQLLAGKIMGFFLFTIASRLAVGHTQPLIQWVLEALCLGVIPPECETDQ